MVASVPILATKLYTPSPPKVVLHINGFSAFMDDSHKMIVGRKLQGASHEVEGLLVEAIGLISMMIVTVPKFFPR